MKRSSTASSVCKSDELKSPNFLKPDLGDLEETFSQISFSYSSTTLNVDDDQVKLLDEDDKKRKNSVATLNLVIDSGSEKSKSLLTLNIEDEPKDLSLSAGQSKSELKLVSPYGDWCAFS